MNQTRQTNASHTFLAAHAIKQLREERGLTQRTLAESLGVTDKAVSKWESGRGLPDISLVEPLAQRLGISVAELLAGDIRANANRAGNMLKGVFYVCPICGNVVHALGEGSFSCCGSTMLPQEAEEPDADHAFSIERIEDDCLRLPYGLGGLSRRDRPRQSVPPCLPVLLPQRSPRGVGRPTSATCGYVKTRRGR